MENAQLVPYIQRVWQAPFKFGGEVGCVCVTNLPRTCHSYMNSRPACTGVSRTPDHTGGVTMHLIVLILYRSMCWLADDYRHIRVLSEGHRCGVWSVFEPGVGPGSGGGCYG